MNSPFGTAQIAGGTHLLEQGHGVSKYFLAGCNVAALHRDQLAEIRNEQIGFVFQGFNLLARTSAVASGRIG